MSCKLLMGSLTSLLLLSGCGGGSQPAPPPPVISVTVTPTTASVHVANNSQFTATVHNSTNQGVSWTITGTGCAGTDCGTVSATGVYTAPAGVPSPASVSVTATAAADATKSSSATVTVLAAVVVTVSPATISVTLGQSQQFTANVQNAADTSVTWNLSSTGCSGSACGSITTTGLYLAPSQVPNPASVTVTATSVEDTAKSGTANTTVTSSIAVAVWPASTQVTAPNNVNYGVASRQFGVLVTGFANTAVNWSVSGAGCSGNTCGMIGSAGLYTAPNTVPNPASVTVTATSQADPGKSANATVELVPSDNSKLSGNYVFLYQGFSLNQPSQVAGAFATDSHGNITNGVFDRTWPTSVGGNLLNQPMTGTYQIGPDNRGTTQWTGSWGSVTFAFALNGLGDKAFLQSFYSTNTRMSGTMMKQTTANFNNSVLQGDFILQLCGADSTGDRQALLGKMHLDGSGHVTSGVLDLNDSSTITSNIAFTATYSVGPFGRGQMIISIPNDTLTYSIYVVSPNQFVLSSTDTIDSSTPLMAGTAIKQSSGAYSLASLNGTTVFQMQGRPTLSTAQVDMGLLTSDGNGHITGVYDENKNNGVSTVINGAFTANYTVDSGGRGTLTSTSIPKGIFYLVSPNNGLFLQEPTGSVMSGSFEPQTALPYGNVLLIGDFASGMVSQLLNNIISATGVVHYNGAGAYSVTLDWNAPSGSLAANDSSSGHTYAVAVNGRVVFTATSGGLAYAYLVSPIKYVEILGAYPSNIPPDDRTHLYDSEQ